VDPAAISPTQWHFIQRALVLLACFAGAGLVAAAAFTAGRAIVASLRATAELAPPFARYAGYATAAAYATAAVATLLACWLLWQALGSAGAVLRDVYPRFAI
jgi:hypothetical protein